MNDLVDRQQVIDAIHYEYDGCCNIDESGSAIADDIERIIDNVPSVQPSDEYNRGWYDGRKALREEMWEYDRDRLD